MNIGSFTPLNNVFLAPMAGVTDKIFRVICMEFGCGLVYTEMVSSKGLYYGSRNTEFLLDIDEREKPTAVQIFGSDPDIMGEIAGTISKNNDVSIIDINMGCPAPKIVKNGEGSALMKNPELAAKVVRNVVEKSTKPVTVKIRKGWDSNSVNAVDFAKRMEAAGALGIAVHGRTREQMYEGKVDIEIIKAVKKAVKIPVIGNGDIEKPEDAKYMLEYTDCDGVMVGRGALGNPWIFKRILKYLQTGEIIDEPDYNERLDMILRHLKDAEAFKGRRGVIEMRKHIAWYLKGLKNASSIRDTINRLDNTEDITDIINKYREYLRSM